MITMQSNDSLNKKQTLPDGTPKMTDTHKWCTRCSRMLEHKHFSKSSQTKGGLATYCKPCKKSYAEELYERRKLEKINSKVCARNGCGTILSRYNKGKLCSIHEGKHGR